MPKGLDSSYCFLPHLFMVVCNAAPSLTSDPFAVRWPCAQRTSATHFSLLPKCFWQHTWHFIQSSPGLIPILNVRWYAHILWRQSTFDHLYFCRDNSPSKLEIAFNVSLTFLHNLLHSWTKCLKTPLIFMILKQFYWRCLYLICRRLSVKAFVGFVTNLKTSGYLLFSEFMPSNPSDLCPTFPSKMETYCIHFMLASFISQHEIVILKAC